MRIYILILTIFEVLSIVFAAQLLGAVGTIIWMILTFFIGLTMLRNIGFSAVFMLGSLLSNANRTLSWYQLLWPIRFVVAALMLMSPGFFSDIIAIVLMLPLKGPSQTSSSHSHHDPFHTHHHTYSQHGDDIIEGEFTVKNHKKDD